uniref:RWP-RK domain-containing protein n=1 Tax=Hordeum vulgare subsp. vulgare TaxID=112509 RepID=A0A8I6YJU8_HORVV
MLMATGDGTDALGLDDDSLPLQDNFDDVLTLLADIPDLGTAPIPLSAPVHREDQPACIHGFCGNCLRNNSTDDGAPGVAQPELPVRSDPSTSSTAADVLDCRGCHVLREVVHSNGPELTKLSIHGAPGVFNHATLDRCTKSEGLAPAIPPRSYIDFRDRDYAWVRHFLTDYALRRSAGNYAVVGDSLSLFLDVLCTTMTRCVEVNDAHDNEGAAGRNGGHGQPAVDNVAAAAVQPEIQRNTELEPAGLFLQRISIGFNHDRTSAVYVGPSPPSNTMEVQVQPQPFQPVVAGRSVLALQRERTRKMQFHDIAPYFHLPIVDAAEKLDICTTVLKGICRRVGVQRWPHRKVKKIDRQITKLMRSGNGVWERNEIERLNVERKRIFYALE